MGNFFEKFWGDRKMTKKLNFWTRPIVLGYFLNACRRKDFTLAEQAEKPSQEVRYLHSQNAVALCKIEIYHSKDWNVFWWTNFLKNSEVTVKCPKTPIFGRDRLFLETCQLLSGEKIPPLRSRRRIQVERFAAWIRKRLWHFAKSISRIQKSAVLSTSVTLSLQPVPHIYTQPIHDTKLKILQRYSQDCPQICDHGL